MSLPVPSSCQHSWPTSLQTLPPSSHHPLHFVCITSLYYKNTYNACGAHLGNLGLLSHLKILDIITSIKTSFFPPPNRVTVIGFRDRPWYLWAHHSAHYIPSCLFGSWTHWANMGWLGKISIDSVSLSLVCGEPLLVGAFGKHLHGTQIMSHSELLRTSYHQSSILSLLSPWTSGQTIVNHPKANVYL